MTAPKLQKGEPSSLDTSHVNLKGSGLEGSGLEGGSERSAGASPKPAVEAAPATGLGRPMAHLWVDNISVSFDGFKALTDLTLTLDRGELR